MGPATLMPQLMTADSYSQSIGATLSPMLTSRDPLLASMGGYPTVGYNVKDFTTLMFPSASAQPSTDPSQTSAQALSSSRAGSSLPNIPSFDVSSVNGTGTHLDNILNPGSPSSVLSPFSQGDGNATQTAPTSPASATQDFEVKDIGLVNKAGLILLAVVIVGIGAYAFVKS